MVRGSYKELVIAMLRTGVLGYGGGPSIIPLIRHEAVIRYKWLDDEEFGEILALANALPGPIATKLAAYLGYRVKGILGAVVSVLSHILPTAIAMIVCLGFFYTFGQSKVIAGMIAAVLPVITVMLGLMAWEFIRKTFKGLGYGWGFFVGAVSFLLMGFGEVNQAVVVILFLLYGSFHLRLLQKLKNNNRQKDVSS